MLNSLNTKIFTVGLVACSFHLEISDNVSSILLIIRLFSHSFFCGKFVLNASFSFKVNVCCYLGSMLLINV